MPGVASPKGANIGDSTQEWYSEKNSQMNSAVKVNNFYRTQKLLLENQQNQFTPPFIFEMYGLQKQAKN